VSVKRGGACLSVRKKKTAARWRGSRGSRRAQRRSVRLLLMGGFGLCGERCSLRQPPFFPSFLSSISSFSGEWAVWTGDELLRRLELGTPGGAVVAYL
jgi:hypothetical protein